MQVLHQEISSQIGLLPISLSEFFSNAFKERQNQSPAAVLGIMYEASIILF